MSLQANLSACGPNRRPEVPFSEGIAAVVLFKILTAIAPLARVIMKKLLLVVSQASLPGRLFSPFLSRRCVILMCQNPNSFCCIIMSRLNCPEPDAVKCLNSSFGRLENGYKSERASVYTLLLERLPPQRPSKKKGKTFRFYRKGHDDVATQWLTDLHNTNAVVSVFLPCTLIFGGWLRNIRHEHPPNLVPEQDGDGSRNKP